jgi:uncharacterized protein YeaO (DUF488 family)
MAIRIVMLGSSRAQDEGLRIGTVRRPPRGVPKSDFAKRNFYDLWLPTLSPSQALVAQGLAVEDLSDWKEFERKFRKEMRRSDASKMLDLLAALSRQTNFSVGCYCKDENRCHRSILKALLHERGAEFVGR